MRPKKFRKICASPRSYFFKPQGIPLRNLEVVEIFPDEFEALKLKNIDRLDQTEAAEKMGISQSTFQRIISGAYEKVSCALFFGKAIKIIEK